MTNNTINNVPRELLERVKSLCEYWFVRGQQQHLSESEHKTWHALGFGSSAFTELRTILSAPSPAGVDGLEVATFLHTLHMELGQTEQLCSKWKGDPFGVAGVDYSNTYSVTSEPLCRLSDAQAIIDGLRGEVDQQAQRIGELASHLEFAVTMLTVAGLAGNAQVEAMRSALSAGHEPQ